jgi:hypothetical protein
VIDEGIVDGLQLDEIVGELLQLDQIDSHQRVDIGHLGLILLHTTSPTLSTRTGTTARARTSPAMVLTKMVPSWYSRTVWPTT